MLRRYVVISSAKRARLIAHYDGNCFIHKRIQLGTQSAQYSTEWISVMGQ